MEEEERLAALAKAKELEEQRRLEEEEQMRKVWDMYLPSYYIFLLLMNYLLNFLIFM